MKRLLHITDCHLFADVDRCGYGQINPYQSLAAILHRVFNDNDQGDNADGLDGVTGEANIDAVIVTGDISGDDSKQSYHHFKHLVARYIPSPIWVIPGNHDNNPHFNDILGDIWLRAGDSKAMGPWHVHGLDTRHKGTQGQVNKEQLDKVSGAMTRETNRHHLLCLHHHLYPSNSWMDAHNLLNPTCLTTWLTQHPNVKALLHGHLHTPLRQCVGTSDTPIFGGPSTSWQWEMSDDFALSPLTPGYQIVTLHDTGHVSVKIERL